MERGSHRGGQPSLANAPLPPPQFSTRSLLAGVTLLGLLLAAWQWLGGLPTLLLTLLLLSLAAHVAGNALGTRLREHHRRASAPGAPGAAGAEGAAGAARKAPSLPFAPATSLAQRRPLGRPLLAALVSGALAGAGSSLHFFAPAPGASWRLDELVAAGAAFAVLGAIAAGVLYSFARVMVEAWWHARRDEK